MLYFTLHWSYPALSQLHGSLEANILTATEAKKTRSLIDTSRGRTDLGFSKSTTPRELSLLELSENSLKKLNFQGLSFLSLTQSSRCMNSPTYRAFVKSNQQQLFKNHSCLRWHYQLELTKSWKNNLERKTLRNMMVTGDFEKLLQISRNLKGHAPIQERSEKAQTLTSHWSWGRA